MTGRLAWGTELIVTGHCRVTLAGGLVCHCRLVTSGVQPAVFARLPADRDALVGQQSVAKELLFGHRARLLDYPLTSRWGYRLDDEYMQDVRKGQLRDLLDIVFADIAALLRITSRRHVAAASEGQHYRRTAVLLGSPD